MLTQLQRAVLTVKQETLTISQPAALTVIPAHPHSTPTGREYRYAGPPSLPSSWPCRQLWRTLVTNFQPIVLIVMPDHPVFTPTGRADHYAGQPHSLPTGRSGHQF